MEMSNNVPVISLFNRADIQKVLEYPSKYPFRPPTEIMSYYRKSRPDRYASMGLVNEQGHVWAKLRSKLTPKTLESKKVLGTFCPELNDICDDFIIVIKEKRNSDDNILENFDPYAKLMTLEAACCLILGRRNSLQDTTDRDLEELMETSKNLFSLFREAYYGNLFYSNLFLKIFNSFLKFN